MSLTKYINEYNKGNATYKRFGWDHLVKPDLDSKALTREDKTMLLESIDRDLQPECLTCDGERPRAQVITRRAMLLKAQAELQAQNV